MKTKGMLKRICAVLLGLALSVAQIPVGAGYIPVAAGTNVASVTVDGNTEEYGSFADAIAELKKNSGSTLTLLDNVTVGERIDFSDGKTYTIDFNGYGIMFSGKADTVIHAASGSAVNLIDSRTENRPDHYITLGNYGRGVAVNDSEPTNGIEGTDYIKVTGGYITGGNYGTGGAIFAEGLGTKVNLGNISIVGNTADAGGGVFVGAGSTFTMNGGAISSNGADYGGGVYVEEKSTFTMVGGEISSNGADAGGGVSVYDGTFTMNGGEISSNEASDGGGVYVEEKSTFTMEGGEISSNEAFYGGGVFVYENSTFTMNGGAISSNEASYKGGGVYIDGSTFTMNDGKISSNKASSDTSSGGGVYVDDESTFTMEGGEISSNGAGVGGGVFVDKGSTFTMESGKILSNNASNKGGGVYVSWYATYRTIFTMGGGEISSNKASYGGGVYVWDTFTMKDGEIKDNKASYGGGVSVCDESDFTMAGGKITGNVAQEYAGGIDVSESQLIIKGSPIVQDNKLKIDENTEKDSNLLVGDNSTVSISGELTENIGVSLNKYNSATGKYEIITGVLAVADASYNGGKISASDAKAFTSDNEYYTVVLKDDGILYYEKTVKVEDIPAQVYTGNSLTPVVKVSSVSGELTLGTDYSITITQDNTETTPVKPGSYDVTVTGKGEYAGSVTKTFVVKKLENKISTVPVANNFTADGSEKALVTAGTADGGKFMYALTTTVTAPEAGAYSSNIPKGINAGTYYVWYKVDGEGLYEDIDAAYVKVTVSAQNPSGGGQSNNNNNNNNYNTSGGGQVINDNVNPDDDKPSDTDGPKVVEQKTTSADGKTETIQRTTIDKSGNEIKETTKETQTENGSVTESSETKTDKDGNVVKTSESKTVVEGSTTTTTSEIAFPTQNLVQTIYQLTSDDKTVSSVKLTDTEGNLIEEKEKTVTQTAGKTVTKTVEEKGSGSKKVVSETVYDDGSTLVKTFVQKKNGKGTYSIVSTDGENTSNVSFSMNQNGEFSVTAETPDADGSVVVESTVKVDGKKHKVTTIAKKAFAGNEALKNIKLGKSVTKIGAGAFAGCENLTDLTFNGKVTSIGKNAFEGIEELTINLPYVKTPRQFKREIKRLTALFEKYGAHIVLNFVAENIK